MKRLIQLIPAHHVRDAAGSEVLTIERIMREAGWDTEIYADTIDDELKDKTKLFSSIDPKALDDTIVLYHFCGGTEMTHRFCELDCKKVMVYHNITPGSFFEPYDKPLANACDVGREQLRVLADNVDLAIAHSEFSREELHRYGFEATRNIPFLIDRERLDAKPDEAMLHRLEGPPVVLFVGRLVPNKAPDDLIRVAQAYFERDYPTARFVQVGKHHILPKYTERVMGLREESGLNDEQLTMLGEVGDSELMACYQAASIFLSLSRHEGFCVPLLEAMRFDVPVVALRRCAVPETLGEAGLLFDTEDPERIARILATVIGDDEARKNLVQRGRERMRRYDTWRWAFVFRVLMEQL